MHIGIPKEIKVQEYRVGMTPAGVRELLHRGHSVLIEKGAGHAIGFDDEHYIQAGATIAPDASRVFSECECIIKVKEPQPSECEQLSDGQILFTYLHLAPDPKQTEALVKSGCIAVAYETVVDQRGHLPLLAPMSEVAGRMAIQAGAHCLEMSQGGNGTLLAGVPGVMPGKVTVIGGGVVGINAARMAMGLGAQVTLLDRDIDRLQELDSMYGPRLMTQYSSRETIEVAVLEADLVVGSVLVPGATAPKLVTRELVRRMQRGAVVVDVAIDQGGCIETSHPTTHDNPSYIEEEVVHYCVANMPGAVARTSTFALTNATLPFVIEIAEKGIKAALTENDGLRAGLNVCKGMVTHEAVASALGYDYTPALQALRGNDA